MPEEFALTALYFVVTGLLLSARTFVLFLFISVLPTDALRTVALDLTIDSLFSLLSIASLIYLEHSEHLPYF